MEAEGKEEKGGRERGRERVRGKEILISACDSDTGGRWGRGEGRGGGEEEGEGERRKGRRGEGVDRKGDLSVLLSLH